MCHTFHVKFRLSQIIVNKGSKYQKSLDARIKFLAILLSVPLFLYLWPSFLGGDTDFIIVQGNSMLPTIEPGSLVITKKSSEYAIDDIVSYPEPENPKKIIIHRIIDGDEKGFIIKGDNNKGKDPGVHPADTILGKVIFSTPYVGYMLGFLRNPLLMMVLGIIAIAVQSDRKRKKKAEPNRNEQIKPKKTDYSIFYVAIIANLLTYMLIQVSIIMGVKPRADVLTNYLFKMFEPSFASTVAFAAYFLFIIGVYYISKSYKIKANPDRKQSRGMRLLMQESNPIHVASQLLWMLFIMSASIQLIAMVQDLLSTLTGSDTLHSLT